MTALYILVALVSGYILNYLHFPFRCLQSRSNGWDYYFRIAVSGSFLSFLALLYVLQYPLNVHVVEAHEVFPFYWSFICLLLAVFLGCLSLLIFYYFPSLRIKVIVKYANRNHFDGLIMESALLVETVLVCMKTGHCVVGVCYPEASFETGESANIAIQPMLCGCYSNEDCELHLVPAYTMNVSNTDEVSRGTDEEYWRHKKMVVAKTEIASISKFDLDSYIS